MASTKVQRIMTQPINLIFRFLQSKARIQIWLFEQKDLRIEGRIINIIDLMAHKMFLWLLYVLNFCNILMHYIYSISPIFVFSATVLILLLWINVKNSVLHMFQGFDEYMNLVLDEAEEVSVKKKSRKPLGENEVVLACVWVTVLLACDLGYRAAYVNACCWVLPFRCLLLF
ncbi:hypothetical protein WN944_022724 [Citrus x changshan-huyou]|uniref:Small nuclear ribonucleoprotein E n=1 Tax=Citrus x changshan-huyou TaxID=2935761 RepID=A0AAP0MZ39_9ROSI